MWKKAVIIGTIAFSILLILAGCNSGSSSVTAPVFNGLAGSPGDRTTGTLSGIPTNQKGDLIKSASVTITPQAGGTSLNYKTGEDGKFAFVLPAGNYTITVTAPAYGTYTGMFSIIADESKSINPVLGQRIILTGTVKLNTTKEPLSSIMVSSYKEGIFTGSTYSTSTGEFIFQDFSPGTYQLSAGQDTTTYSPATYVVYIMADGSTSPAAPEVILAPRPITASDVVCPLVFGTVIDSFTKAPLQYVVVSVKGVGGTISDAQGRFSFSNLRPGNYEILFSKTGWQDLTQEFTVNSTNGVVSISPSPLAFLMNQNVETGVGAISGRYATESTGVGINGLIVRVYPMNYISKKITVMTQAETASAPAQFAIQDVTHWEIDTNYILSTRTGEDSSPNVSASGSFRLEHLHPTSDVYKYLIYVGNANSTLTTAGMTDPADVGTGGSGFGKAVWLMEDTNNVSRIYSWSMVDVTVAITTYLSNYNNPDY
ncbi:MAG: carboxypeptidase regulatory-like domain-containing protein [Candidatus Riflebacteria bacterium]|nr:carboxypeptidase regulatory-like domain-containing protein [Candidatus Riflebacteria bacterium]